MAQSDSITEVEGLRPQDGALERIKSGTDLLVTSSDEVHQHQVQRQHDLAPQGAPASPRTMMGAQTSHGLMGSGGQEEIRGPGRRFPRKLQKGELFQKIHSMLFFLLASMVATVDAILGWAVHKAAAVWGTPVTQPFHLLSDSLGLTPTNNGAKAPTVEPVAEGTINGKMHTE